MVRYKHDLLYVHISSRQPGLVFTSRSCWKHLVSLPENLAHKMDKLFKEVSVKKVQLLVTSVMTQVFSKHTSFHSLHRSQLYKDCLLLARFYGERVRFGAAVSSRADHSNQHVLRRTGTRKL